jgi:hypothetical protein
MQKLAEALRKKRRGRVSIGMNVVHQSTGEGASVTSAVAAGVRATEWREFVGSL